MDTPIPGFDRLTVNPQKMSGKPCVRGMRISVERLLDVLASDPSGEELRVEFPEIEADDVKQALAFAAASLAGQRFISIENDAA